MNHLLKLVTVFDRKPQASLKLLNQAELRQENNLSKYCKSSDKQTPRCAALSRLYGVYLT